MSELSVDDLERRIDAMRDLRVLVVGDVLLDEYRLGDVDRISPEAPVPIIRVRDERVELGGAGNVARGIVSLGAACDLVGVIGADPEGATFRARAEEVGVASEGLIESDDRSTSHKLRVVARGQQMIRLDREDDHALSSSLAERVREAVNARLDACDAVVLEDYGKGLFSEGKGPSLGRWIIEVAKERGRLVAADPKQDLARFRGAGLVKPNWDEAERFLPGHARDSKGRRNLIEKLQRELGGGEIVVTRGADGMSALASANSKDDGRGVFDVSTRALEVYDVQGAGDTSIAALTLCRAAGASLREACIVANAAASVAVGKVGTAAVTRDELVERLRAGSFGDEERM